MCNVEGPPLKKGIPMPLSYSEPLPIYLDYNASTPICEESKQKLIETMSVHGNPSSSHSFGLASKFEIENSRSLLGKAINSNLPSDEIIFTSGGTEANNLAIMGVLNQIIHQRINDVTPGKCFYILTSSIEHPSIEELLVALESNKLIVNLFQIIVLRCPVNPYTGSISALELTNYLNQHKQINYNDIILCTIMHANNEIGSVFPISELVDVVKKFNPVCIFHSDASQSVGKIHINVQELKIDLLTICGQKCYAPKGTGALFIKKGTPIMQIIFGASQERGLRPGTENVLLIPSFTQAILELTANFKSNVFHMLQCRFILYQTLLITLQNNNFDIMINGDHSWYKVSLFLFGSDIYNPKNFESLTEKELHEITSNSLTRTLPNTLSITIKYKPTNIFINATRLIVELSPAMAISAGAACHSFIDPDEIVTSPTLNALGHSQEYAQGTLRLSTGLKTTISEVRRAARLLGSKILQQLVNM